MVEPHGSWLVGENRWTPLRSDSLELRFPGTVGAAFGAALKSFGPKFFDQGSRQERRDQQQRLINPERFRAGRNFLEGTSPRGDGGAHVQDSDTRAVVGFHEVSKEQCGPRLKTLQTSVPRVAKFEGDHKCESAT